MGAITARQRLRWKRRAETIEAKARGLHADMIHALGVEHSATDYSDNLVVASEDILTMAEKLTDAEREFLSWLPQDSTKWRTVHIDRSGCSKHLTAARQRCASKGLAVMSEMLRRTWRITESGRAALAGGSRHDGE